MVVRRECLAEVGNFDEEIRRPTTQDYDLCFRIARHHELAYVDEPLVLYRLHASNASKEPCPCGRTFFTCSKRPSETTLA